MRKSILLALAIISSIGSIATWKTKQEKNDNIPWQPNTSKNFQEWRSQFERERIN